MEGSRLNIFSLEPFFSGSLVNDGGRRVFRTLRDLRLSPELPTWCTGIWMGSLLGVGQDLREFESPLVLNIAGIFEWTEV